MFDKDWISPALQLKKHTVLRATIHPDIKRTLVAISKRTGMTVSQVADEVLYTGLIEMQDLDAPTKALQGRRRLYPLLHRVVNHI